jgi:hypothetical protein
MKIFEPEIRYEPSLLGTAAISEKSRGIQLAGGAVALSEHTGLQLGAGTYANAINGAQIGAVNLGGEVKGVQIGVFQDDVGGFTA